MPNVTGTPLPQAEADLTASHLVPQPQASYDSAAPTDTNVVQTNPTAGATVSPSSTVQVFVPTFYDMTQMEQSAQWMEDPSGATPQAGQQSPGPDVLTGAVLTDCTMASQALETVPPPVANGTITGTYNLNGPTIAGEVFRADIGFLQGTPSGQTITYQVIAITGGSRESLVPVNNNTISSGSDQVKPVMESVPLGTTEVELIVTAQGAPSASDDVVWVAPRIDELNAPAEQQRPTATACPSPSPSASPTP